MCNPGSSAVTTLDSTGNVGLDTSVAIGSDGLPIVSYFDATNRNLKVAHCDDPLCTTATIRTVDSANDVGSYSSLAIASNGLPIISYRDNTARCVGGLYCGIQGQLRIARCGDLTCSTATTSTLVASTATTWVAPDFSSLTIGSDGIPTITFASETRELLVPIQGRKISLLRCNSPTCTGVATTWIVDSRSYDLGVGGYAGFWPASVLTGAGQVLTTYGVSEVDLSYPGETGQHIAYCGSPACSTGSRRFFAADTTYGDGHSMTQGADGFALITRRRSSDGALRVSHCGNAECSSATTATVENSGRAGPWVDVSLGTDHLGVIAYQDTRTSQLRLAHCNNTACSSISSRLIDSATGVGSRVSLAIDASGRAVTSYYDSLNGDLKVAVSCPVSRGCGDGVIQDDEQCDDGNALSGDSCDELCRIPTPTPTRTSTLSPTLTATPSPTLTETQTPSLTPTDSPIVTATATVTPTETGTPSPSPTSTETPPCGGPPRPDCIDADRSSFGWRSSPDKQLKWKWRGSSPETLASFSDATASYTLCLYDFVAGEPASALRLDAPADARCGDKLCWSGEGSSRKFYDRSATGRLEIRLRSATSGNASIKVRTGGDRLPDHVPASETEFLDQDPEFVIQLQTAGACWQASYSAPARRHSESRFDDRTP